jgi:replicative DNA helicase
MASAYTGFTKDQLEKNASNLKAAKSVLKSKDLFSKLDIRAGQGWSLSDLETHIKALKSDIVFIDQADKLSVAGSFEANHHKLRELYLQLREIAKRQQCAIIAVSQASQSAIGKTRVMPSDAEGSRIGKFAEADLVFGIGKYDDDSSGEEGDDIENTSRFITVGKNKLNGYHGTVVCKIEPQRSRYVE